VLAGAQGYLAIHLIHRSLQVTGHLRTEIAVSPFEGHGKIGLYDWHGEAGLEGSPDVLDILSLDAGEGVALARVVVSRTQLRDRLQDHDDLGCNGIQSRVRVIGLQVDGVEAGFIELGIDAVGREEDA